MTRGAIASFRAAAAALTFLLTPSPAAAQDVRCDPGDVEVVALSFSGNRMFSAAALADGIVTTPSSWARRHFRFLGTRRCLDRPQFPGDVLRLLLWYRNHGYFATRVDTAITAAGEGRVAVKFTISEGEPVIISTLTFAGLEGVPERDRVVGGLAARLGQPFDRYAMEETRDSLASRLHNRGYPDAEVFLGWDTRMSERTATVGFTVMPGARVKIYPLRVRVTPRPGAKRGLDNEAVLRVAGVSAGDLYSEENLGRAKRSLYRTDAYAQVAVVTDSAPAPGDSTIGVTLDLAEGYMRATSVGGGYGTLDCFRATADFTQYNFLGGAARLDVRAKLSKIGIGAPLGGAPSLCPQAKQDPYSRDLNYFVGASASRPAIFHEFAPSLTLFSERRSEYNAFLRTTPAGGALSVVRSLGRVTQMLGYSLEFGRTEAQPALLCAVFNACEQADRDAFGRLQRLGVASVALSRETGDNPVNPTRGTVVRLELRTAGGFTGSEASLRFTKMLVDAAGYVPMGRDVVLAARLRVGAVVGPSFRFSNEALFVPPQERLFAGGPTTVRGFSQNELGPAVYLPTAYDTVRADGSLGGSPADPRDTVYFRSRAGAELQRIVPTGGNALVVANLEARMRSPVLPDLIQWTAFADVGEVWNRGATGANLGFKALRWTPGLGLRVRTLIGFVRLDVAYNPYDRPTGSAYFDTPIAAGGSGGALFCVSPGNTLRVTATAGGSAQQAAGGCAASFVPRGERAFIRRLTPSISIGQAF